MSAFSMTYLHGDNRYPNKYRLIVRNADDSINTMYELDKRNPSFAANKRYYKKSAKKEFNIKTRCGMEGGLL